MTSFLVHEENLFCPLFLSNYLDPKGNGEKGNNFINYQKHKQKITKKQTKTTDKCNP